MTPSPRCAPERCSPRERAPTPSGGAHAVGRRVRIRPRRRRGAAGDVAFLRRHRDRCGDGAILFVHDREIVGIADILRPVERNAEAKVLPLRPRIAHGR